MCAFAVFSPFGRLLFLIETYFAHKPDPDAIATQIRDPDVPLMSQNGRRIAVSPSKLRSGGGEH